MWQMILLTISPISELRGSIPFGIVAGYNPLLVLLLAIILNIAIYFPIRYILGLIGNRLPLPYLNSVRRRSKPLVDRYGKYALVLFIGVPLPLSGVYTAAVISWLLGFKIRTAIMPVIVGVTIAGIVVTLLTIGIREIV